MVDNNNNHLEQRLFNCIHSLLIQ